MVSSNSAGTPRTLEWVGDAISGTLRLIDQTRLPTDLVEVECRDVAAVWNAIKTLQVRGAPAIGVAAAYGAVIGARGQGVEDFETVERALIRSRRVSRDEPADGRQPVLGTRPDEPSAVDRARP